MMAASAHEVSPPWPAIPPLPIQPAPRRALRCLTVADVAAWQARNCQEERVEPLVAQPGREKKSSYGRLKHGAYSTESGESLTRPALLSQASESEI